MMDDHETRITETVDDFLDDRGVARPIIADLAHPVLPGLPNKAFERMPDHVRSPIAQQKHSYR